MKSFRLTSYTFSLLLLFFSSLTQAADTTLIIPLYRSTDDGGLNTVSSAGQEWLDRNLGALRTAAKKNDPDSYGTLFQWGRNGDGHEYRTSPTTTVNTNSDYPGHGKFILEDTPPYDWRSTQKDSLWQGAAGINNPCPAGFRIPTETELEIERASWRSNDAAGAFASPVKLVLSGWRHYSAGSYHDPGIKGTYWSSTTSITVDGHEARYLEITDSIAFMSYAYRAFGLTIRCIKD